MDFVLGEGAGRAVGRCGAGIARRALAGDRVAQAVEEVGHGAHGGGRKVEGVVGLPPSGGW